MKVLLKILSLSFLIGVSLFSAEIATLDSAVSRIRHRKNMMIDKMREEKTTDSYHTCQGRLTVESGVPVSTTDQASKSTLYFTPYNGTKIALYDGTKWVNLSFTQISIALSGLTSAKPYDVYIYDNSGTPALELLVWTNTTTRATNLTTQNGVYVQTGAATRRYIGTVYTSSATTTEDTATKRFVYNYYNRVVRPMYVTETADSWTYSTASFQSANSSTSNRVEYVLGLAERGPVVKGLLIAGTSNTSFVLTGVGIGTGSVTINGGVGTAPSYIDDIQRQQLWTSSGPTTTAVGYTYFQLLEYGEAVNGVTFYGDDGGDDRVRSGIVGWIEN